MYEKEAASLASKAKKKVDPETGDDESTETKADDEGAEGEDMSSYDDVESSAADELASLAGVKDRAAFKSALSDYVQACVKKAMA